MTKNNLVTKITISLFSIIYILLNYFTFLSFTKAASTGSVSATVTAQNISLSVASGTVAYGTLGIGSSKDTTLNGGNHNSQTITNTGNIAETFNIKGINSTSAGIGWTLASVPGVNTYAHKFCNTNCDSSPTWTALTLNYATLSVGISSGATAPAFDLEIFTPTSTTDFNQQTVDVTVQATQ